MKGNLRKMKPCGKPWGQLNLHEKIEALHKQQEVFRKYLNKLGRMIIEKPGVNPYLLTGDELKRTEEAAKQR